MRALRENRLPASVEAWHADREMWVPLSGHPAALAALESIGMYTPRSPEAPAAPPPPDPPASEDADSSLPEFELTTDIESDFEAAPPLADVELEVPEEIVPTDLPRESIAQPIADTLAEAAEPAQEVTAHPEPSAPPEEPRKPPAPLPPPRPSRASTAMPRERSRPSVRKPVEPPPAPEPPAPAPQSIPRRQLVLLGLCLVALGLVVWNRIEEGKAAARAASADSTPARPVATTPAAPTAPDTAPDSLRVAAATESLPVEFESGTETPVVIQPLALKGLPGAGPEKDLETRLSLAGAITWDPSDFSSPAAVLRARRKVDAVLNSLAAYRVDMRRYADSVGPQRVGNRLEPYEEATRIDDVVRRMGDAIGVLEDIPGRYQVRGGVLTFDRVDDAVRFNRYRNLADSLLHARVELDLHPMVRPPRRLVTALFASFPSGLARP